MSLMALTVLLSLSMRLLIFADVDLIASKSESIFLEVSSSPILLAFYFRVSKSLIASVALSFKLLRSAKFFTSGIALLT